MTTQCHKPKRRHAGWRMLLAGSLMASLGVSESAPPPRRVTNPPPPAAQAPAEAPIAPQPKVEEAPATQGRTYNLTLKQLGLNYPMTLRGVDGSDTVNFNVRADEIVTKASLKLYYAYSPALLPEVSHINVMVNEGMTATIPVPKETAGTELERDIDIPPRLITEFNRLRLQLIGHYTYQCEDPLHSSLWAKVSNASVLELQTTPIALYNDLDILPLPFMDRRDPRRINLPFVFGNKPDGTALEAAGVLASWFGATAAYRGARFPVQFEGAIPAQGNAVVFVIGRTSTLKPDGTDISGPTLSMVPNPNDPTAKLLLVMGRDSKELKIAATAVSVGSQALSGQTASITKLETLAPRRPYDAPNWIPSDRPTPLGELATPLALNASGFNPPPIRVDMRVPPDLFGWREGGVPVNLKYRYTPQPNLWASTLLVNVNDKFAKSFSLLPLQTMGDSQGLLSKMLADDTLPVEARFELPLSMIAPQTRLDFRYMYDVNKQGECRDVILDNVRGAIEPDSTIDISGFSHFIAMPNLGVFRDAGFPFTRMADLSETAVVMPDAPSAAEITTYLEILGRMGASTGYPATGVQVVTGSAVESASDKDLLLIAAGSNLPLLKQWSNYLPASFDGGRRFAISDLAYKTWDLFSPDPDVRKRQARLDMLFKSNGQSGIFAGFESPLKGNRSAVLVWGVDGDSLLDNSSALLGGEDYDDYEVVAGSLTTVRGKQVDALVNEQTYFVGSLGWFRNIQWTLSRHLGVFMMLSVLSAILLAVLLFLILQAKARRRLPE